MSSQSGPYTFGDNPVAATRLELLADVYAGSAETFLRRWAPSEVATAVDLGCGPGHTTALVARVSGATETIGLDRSPAFLALTGERSDGHGGRPEGHRDAGRAANLRFIGHDVTQAPLPVSDVDLMYCRFVLTHLADPAGALAGWVPALRPGGRILLQETARLGSRDPVLGAYYEAVAAMQAWHGQELDLGGRLAELAPARGTVMVYSGRRVLNPPVRTMAVIHALNLNTWREDEAARALFDRDELDGLGAGLSAIAHGEQAVEPIEQELGELVLERVS